MKGFTWAPLLRRQGLIYSVGVVGIVSFALTLGAGLLGRLLATALVLPVVQSCKGQDIEEEQRCSHSNGDAEFCRVISGVGHNQGTHLSTSFAITMRCGHGRPASDAGPLAVGLGGIQRGDFGCR